ncbi:MAG: DUF5060 domain-containing protein [Caldilineaceae bacterium]|nr:DUF5060 domain-containing protein [Caldilineaceae bacterium]
MKNWRRILWSGVLLALLVASFSTWDSGLGALRRVVRALERQTAPNAAIHVVEQSAVLSSAEILENPTAGHVAVIAAHRQRPTPVLMATASPSTTVPAGAMMGTPVRGTQWGPYLEWVIENSSYTGNPFDLVATATFTHTDSGETRETALFYAGASFWKFRFTGTRPGLWHFTTRSADSELDGIAGSVEIRPNPNPKQAGFVSNRGNHWIRTATGSAFVPQFVMFGGPHVYYEDAAQIDDAIQTFLVEHGFTGFHVPVFCRWFDINEAACRDINQEAPNPDLRTFAALELLITKTYNAGGTVHLWAWGDDSRGQNPKKWGLNGTVDQRLQRYIAARLGPLPGWTVGYGFDLREWVTGQELEEWHATMQDALGWPHLMGARGPKNKLTQLTDALDYVSYEQHKPDYELYVKSLELNPDKAVFSEDRFRIRDEGNNKDYDMAETRRGLWHSAMAGGVANIWGNLIGAAGANEGSTNSAPYPRPEWIQTYARFFANRFYGDMVRCNALTDGVCLKRPSNAHFLFYREDASAIALDLATMNDPQPAVAVDTRKRYAEIKIGPLAAESQTWEAPYPSDWAIAVGTFPTASDGLPMNTTIYLPLID